MFDEVRPKIAEALQDAVAQQADAHHAQLQQVVRRVIGAWVTRKLRRRPMIVPVVIEA